MPPPMPLPPWPWAVSREVKTNVAEINIAPTTNNKPFFQLMRILLVKGCKYRPVRRASAPVGFLEPDYRLAASFHEDVPALPHGITLSKNPLQPEQKIP